MNEHHEATRQPPPENQAYPHDAAYQQARSAQEAKGAYQKQYPQESPVYMPNGVLNFFLSLIPGVGQMYQGLMRRGVLLMALFAGAITLTGVFSDIHIYGLGAIFVGISITAIVIIYFFSFFDSLRTCRMIRNGVWMGDREQDLLVELPTIKFAHGGHGRKVVGVILVVVGALGLCGYLVNEFVPYAWIQSYLRPTLNLLFPLALLIAGIVLLIKGRKPKEKAV